MQNIENCAKIDEKMNPEIENIINESYPQEVFPGVLWKPLGNQC